MGFFGRFFQREEDSSGVWCIAFIDLNPFRRARMMDLLNEAGIEVKHSSTNLLVKRDQYDQAISLLRR
jgi:hypothetical protein